MLGLKVQHKIHGLSGVVTAISSNLAGQHQVAITSSDPTAEGKWFDIDFVNVLDEKSGVTKKRAAKTDISLGDPVEHFSGFKGRVTERVQYVNGCVFFGVVPNTGEADKMPETQYISSVYLKLDEDGDSIETEQTGTGGPSIKAPIM